MLYHEGFDVIWLDGDVGHEVGVFALADEVVVFKADAEVFLWEVDAGLDGEEHAWGDGEVGGGDVVDVEAEVVGGAVHEVFFDEGLGVVLGGGLLWGEEV